MELWPLSKKKPWLVLAYNIVSAIYHVISEATWDFIMITYFATCILNMKIILFYICALKTCILLLAWLIDGSRIWYFSRRDWLISRQPAQLAPHNLSTFILSFFSIFLFLIDWYHSTCFMLAPHKILQPSNFHIFKF